MKKLLPLLLSALLVPGALQANELSKAVARDYDAHLAPLLDYFHRNPELSFLEVKTAARMAKELRAAGFTVTEGVGGTGVVAILKNGPGPLVMMRADMDGLPMQEKSGLPNAATVTQKDMEGNMTPVAHSCGHDIHMTSLVGTARRMASDRANWSGTLMLNGIRRMAEHTARAAGMLDTELPEVKLVDTPAPPVLNNVELVRRLKTAWTATLGADAFGAEEFREGMGSEDFPQFVTDPYIPSVYFTVGGTAPETIAAAKVGTLRLPSHHSPLFKVEHGPAVRMGVEATVVALQELMPRR